jgi:uroporphyrinogen-III synthase
MVKIVAQALVITSILALDTIQKAAKLLPSALILKDEDKQPLFAIGAGAAGSISSAGVTYNSTSADGKAQATIMLPNGIAADKREDYVRDNFGASLVLLARAEAHTEEALAERQHEIDVVLTGMEVQ